MVRSGNVESAMGLRALGIQLVNCGTRPYSVQGPPVVRVLDADQHPMDVTVADVSMIVCCPAV